MTFSKTLKTAALTLMIALPVAGAASANGSYVNVQQYGYGNGAAGAQTGFLNDMGIYQNGAYNTTIASQDGNFNTTVVGQTGYGNGASATTWSTSART